MENSSVDNHAILAIFYVVQNWQKVKIYKEKSNGREKDEVIVSDCDAWHFLGDTMSQGKKTDHISHNACLDYMASFYNNEQQKKNLEHCMNR